ncbi:MAG: cytidine/deoxycytidylate deaminase family protein [Candidatus Aenigmatarchaeota archaeon]
MRPSWDEYFMEIAKVVAKRSTCKRAAVGAVIVKDKRILTTGYAGAPKGMPHCLDVGCLIKSIVKENGKTEEHCLRTVHAEMNAIIQAALHGVSTDGATIYTTHFPCYNCAKVIINAGIKRIVADSPNAGKYVDEESLNLLKSAGIEVVVLNV